MRILTLLTVLSVTFSCALASAAAPTQPESDQLKGSVEMQRQVEAPLNDDVKDATVPPSTTDATTTDASTPEGDQQAVSQPQAKEPESQKAVASAVPPKAATKEKPRDPFKAANELIKQQKYSEALAILNTVQPPTELSHYYMGLSYQYLNQMAKAKNEYLWVYQKGTNPQLRNNAGIAYTQVAQYETRRTYAGQGNAFARVNYSYPPAPRVIVTSSGTG